MTSPFWGGSGLRRAWETGAVAARTPRYSLTSAASLPYLEEKNSLPRFTTIKPTSPLQQRRERRLLTHQFSAQFLPFGHARSVVPCRRSWRQGDHWQMCDVRAMLYSDGHGPAVQRDPGFPRLPADTTWQARRLLGAAAQGGRAGRAGVGQTVRPVQYPLADRFGGVTSHSRAGA